MTACTLTYEPVVVDGLDGLAVAIVDERGQRLADGHVIPTDEEWAVEVSWDLLALASDFNDPILARFDYIATRIGLEGSFVVEIVD